MTIKLEPVQTSQEIVMNEEKR